MSVWEEFLDANFPVVLFVYGLAFFTLGLAVSLRYRRHSQFILAKRLWLLSVFAFMHGFAEWGLLFIPLQQPYFQQTTLEVLRGIQVLLWSASFLFLFLFGLHLIIDRFPAFNRAIYIPVIIFGLWLVRFGLEPILNLDFTTFRAWYSSADLWSRYLLAIPGSLAAGIGLMMQRQDLQKVKMPRSDWYMAVAVTGLLGYGFAEGMIVRAGDFFPASVFNSDTIFRTLRIPIEMLRALLGVIITVGITSILGIFNAENDRQLQQARRQATLYEERGRIGRDLHDGVIQSLYAISLSLQRLKFLNKDQPTTFEPLKEIISRLDQVMQDIRDYIRNLPVLGNRPTPLESAVNTLVEEFRAATRIKVKVNVMSSAGQSLTPQTTEHLYFIIKEALSNVARHSQASRVHLFCSTNDKEVELVISDNGIGFSTDKVINSTETGQGLINMRTRIEKTGGNCRINSSPGKGTEVNVKMPREVTSRAAY